MYHTRICKWVCVFVIYALNEREWNVSSPMSSQTKRNVFKLKMRTQLPFVWAITANYFATKVKVLITKIALNERRAKWKSKNNENQTTTAFASATKTKSKIVFFFPRSHFHFRSLRVSVLVSEQDCHVRVSAWRLTCYVRRWKRPKKSIENVQVKIVSW